MIKWRWAPVALLWYLLTSILWIVGWLVGFVLGSWHAWRGNFGLSLMRSFDDNLPVYQWKSAFMRRWFQTRDNGACPQWYLGRWMGTYEWTVRRAVWDFSVLRNGFGGNPWNMYNFPGDEVLYKSDNGSSTRLTVRLINDVNDGTPKRMYMITQSQYEPWKMGVWFLFPRVSKEKPYRHFEIRHGYKFYPDRELDAARFSVWDTGPRS